ncbi:hypothetical protein BGZ95_011515 [Linnemannia exigua]|uniref:Uncharacterized protein n=1 Tax=Linnemannia exigua TaxID=604196 RepID=A0AAD4H470_9FUNG|nr:hypothetical protein BGZ95_011515 [Linnemannia exigua]
MVIFSADVRMSGMPNKRPRNDEVEQNQSEGQDQGVAAAHLFPQINRQIIAITTIHRPMVTSGFFLAHLILSSSNRTKTPSTATTRMTITTMTSKAVIKILTCTTPNIHTNLDTGPRIATSATTPNSNNNSNNNNNNNVVTTIATTLQMGSRPETKSLDKTPIGSMVATTEDSIEDEDVAEVEEVAVVVEVKDEAEDEVDLAFSIDTRSLLVMAWILAISLKMKEAPSLTAALPHIRSKAFLMVDIPIMHWYYWYQK